MALCNSVYEDRKGVEGHKSMALCDRVHEARLLSTSLPQKWCMSSLCLPPPLANLAIFKASHLAGFEADVQPVLKLAIVFQPLRLYSQPILKPAGWFQSRLTRFNMVWVASKLAIGCELGLKIFTSLDECQTPLLNRKTVP